MATTNTQFCGHGSLDYVYPTDFYSRVSPDQRAQSTEVFDYTCRPDFYPLCTFCSVYSNHYAVLVTFNWFNAALDEIIYYRSMLFILFLFLKHFSSCYRGRPRTPQEPGRPTVCLCCVAEQAPGGIRFSVRDYVPHWEGILALACGRPPKKQNFRRREKIFNSPMMMMMIQFILVCANTL